MKSAHALRLLATLTCAALASCASSTMDSIPTDAQLEQYRDQARPAFSGEFQYLSEERKAGRITVEEYDARRAQIEEKVTQYAHTLAWQNHELAEIQRSSQGVPTPSAPQQLQAPNAMNGGAGGGNGQYYQSALSQYSMASGIGGGSNVRVGQQLGNSRSAGALATPNYPGTVYDDPNQ